MTSDVKIMPSVQSVLSPMLPVGQIYYPAQQSPIIQQCVYQNQQNESLNVQSKNANSISLVGSYIIRMPALDFEKLKRLIEREDRNREKAKERQRQLKAVTSQLSKPSLHKTSTLEYTVIGREL